MLNPNEVYKDKTDRVVSFIRNHIAGFHCTGCGSTHAVIVRFGMTLNMGNLICIKCHKRGLELV